MHINVVILFYVLCVYVFPFWSLSRNAFWFPLETCFPWLPWLPLNRYFERLWHCNQSVTALCKALGWRAVPTLCNACEGCSGPALCNAIEGDQFLSFASISRTIPLIKEVNLLQRKVVYFTWEGLSTSGHDDKYWTRHPRSKKEHNDNRHGPPRTILGIFKIKHITFLFTRYQ